MTCDMVSMRKLIDWIEKVVYHLCASHQTDRRLGMVLLADLLEIALKSVAVPVA